MLDGEEIRNGWKISVMGEAKEEKNIGKAKSHSNN